MDDFPKDKEYDLKNIDFLKAENFYFGDFLYRSKITKQNVALNKQGYKNSFSFIKIRR